MKKKMMFIYNPHAGKAQIRSNLLDIIDIFTKAGFEVTAYPTQEQGDATRATREMEPGYDVVVCCGGDGTLDEVVSGMLRREDKIPIGYVPAGSTNDFANSLGIPKKMVKAADTVVQGNLFSCDMGSFNDEFFVYVAAFGLFTEVSYETKQELKNLLGHAAYVLEGTKRLTSIQSYEMEIEYDGNVIKDEFLYGMVSNSLSVGGMKNFTGKNVKLDDGLFEVTLIRKPKQLADYHSIARDLLMGESDSSYIYMFKTSRLKIRSTESIPWTLDGEYGGAHTEVELKNMNQVLQMIVPE